jgi:carboxypeptidase PM20D1
MPAKADGDIAGHGIAASQIESREVAARLSRLIRVKTVSSRKADEVEWPEFDRFIALLPELYPESHNALSRELVGDYSMLYRWKGKGEGAPLVLMAHYDVVSAPSEGWKEEPFGGAIADTESDGKAVWGRGSLDTKVTLACIFEAVESLAARGFQPERDVYLSFGHNEEVMGGGTPGIVALLKERGIVPGLVVDEGGAIVRGAFPGVKEPLALVGIAEKGVTDIELSAASPGGHASTPPRRGAAWRLSRAIMRLERKPFRASLTEPAEAMLKTLAPHTRGAFRFVLSHLRLFGPLLVAAFTRGGGETNALCRTTLAVTMLEGSKGANVLPAKVRAVINIRISIGESSESVVARVRKIVADPGVEVKVLYRGEPSPVSDASCAEFDMVAATIRETYPEVIVSPYLMLGASDARHYAALSKHVYRFSPLEMSKEERESMHGINERVPVAKLGKCAEFYERLIAKW